MAALRHLISPDCITALPKELNNVAIFEPCLSAACCSADLPGLHGCQSIDYERRNASQRFTLNGSMPGAEVNAFCVISVLADPKAPGAIGLEEGTVRWFVE